MTETGERCQHCNEPAIGDVNGLPFCAKDSCIKAVIKTAFEPIAAARERLARAQARRDMPVEVAR